MEIKTVQDWEKWCETTDKWKEPHNFFKPGDLFDKELAELFGKNRNSTMDFDDETEYFQWDNYEDDTEWDFRTNKERTIYETFKRVGEHWKYCGFCFRSEDELPESGINNTYIRVHRGSTQIGGNIIEIATGTCGTRIILDCGRNLPALDGTQADDEIEIEGLTVSSWTNDYDAVFISHYHGDHCGHVNSINEGIPVYMTEVTKDVLTIIADFTNKELREDITTFKDCVIIDDFGNGDISVTPIHVPIQVICSAADVYMFLVRTGGKVILYTGDYKKADRVIPKIKELLGENERIDVMITEGTNIAPVGNAAEITTEDELIDECAEITTEDELTCECAEIMWNTLGDVFVLGSSTNTDRVNAISYACDLSGKTFAQDLFTACIMKAVGGRSALTMSHIKSFVWQQGNRMKKLRLNITEKKRHSIVMIPL